MNRERIEPKETKNVNTDKIDNNDLDMDVLLYLVGKRLQMDADYDDYKYEKIMSEMSDVDPPDTLKAALKRINHEAEKQARKSNTDVRRVRLKSRLKICVLLAAVLIMTFTLMAPQAQALRDKVYEIIIENIVSDGALKANFDLSSDSQANNDKKVTSTGGIEDKILYPSVMPDNLERESIEQNGEYMDVVLLNKSNNDFVSYTYYKSDESSNVFMDTDNSDIRNILVNGQDAILRVDEKQKYLYWSFDNRIITASFRGQYWNDDTIINFAESLKWQ